MQQTTLEGTLSTPQPANEPSRFGRWLLAGVLFFAYLPMQVLLTLPVVAAAVTFYGVDSLDQLMESQAVLWLTLAATAIAAVMTIAAALVWPWVWNLLTGKRVSQREWISWQRLKTLPLWTIPLVTVPLLVLMSLVVSRFIGPTDVQIQLQLFSTPALGVASGLIVSTIVPVAEELIFRGALYNAALPEDRGQPAWRRHLVPFLLTAVLFASVHLLSGFETPSAILQIFLLSAFLSGLRAVTGSVRASMAAHLTWNMLAALGLLLSMLAENLPI